MQRLHITLGVTPHFPHMLLKERNNGVQEKETENGNGQGTHKTGSDKEGVERDEGGAC